MYSLGELVECRIIERINRFTVKIIVDGAAEMAHLTNTGRLYDILVRDRRCLAKEISSKKLRYRLIAVEDAGGYSVIDTLTQNRFFEHAINNDMVPFLRECRVIRRNPRINTSRLDFKLRCRKNHIVYIETKSAVLRGTDNAAMYPDCPSLRGRRHLREIIELNKQGTEAHVVFIAAMPHPRCFKPYTKGDPELARLIGVAVKEHVPVEATSFYMDKNGSIIYENPVLPLCPEWLETILNLGT